MVGRRRCIRTSEQLKQDKPEMVGYWDVLGSSATQIPTPENGRLLSFKRSKSEAAICHDLNAEIQWMKDLQLQKSDKALGGNSMNIAARILKYRVRLARLTNPGLWPIDKVEVRQQPLNLQRAIEEVMTVLFSGSKFQGEWVKTSTII
jgi:hypothetical protein